MLAPRDSRGRFLPGHSGNPAGRPKGARDKGRRFRFVSRQPWAATNLGEYSLSGGPGRTRGGKNRSEWDRYLEALAILEAARRRGEMPFAATLRLLKLDPTIKSPLKRFLP